MLDSKNSILKLIPILIILIFAFIIRLYNINYEDFWTDEIFAFFTSEPNITFKETLIRTLDSNFNSLFDFLLKEFHTIFGYDVYISRYFSFIISFFSLILFAFLLNRITSYPALLFGLYILSINIFHIRYSIEVRSYILTFLLVLFFFYLNFKDQDRNITLTRLALIIFTSILMLLCHSFTILILGSLSLYKIIKYYKYKEISRNEIFLILGLVIVSALYLFIYLPINIQYADQLLGLSPHWIKQVKPSFYTNFFFSQYFGSRILGLIYLLILIYLIIKFNKILLDKFNIYSFFVILIICSYSIPLIYGYFFGPILISRYIMFVLIPIICILSHFIFLIKNSFIKYLFIVLIGLTTTINHIFFENTFKQFYTDIYYTKPQVKDALKKISESEVKNFTIKKINAKEKNLNESYENYIIKYLEKIELDINYFNYQNSKNIPKKFWVLDIKDAYKEDLLFLDNLKDYQIVAKNYFNSVELILLRKDK